MGFTFICKQTPFYWDFKQHALFEKFRSYGAGPKDIQSFHDKSEAKTTKVVRLLGSFC